MISTLDKASKICIAWITLAAFLHADQKYMEMQSKNMLLLRDPNQTNFKQNVAILGFVYFTWKTLNW